MVDRSRPVAGHRTCSGVCACGRSNGNDGAGRDDGSRSGDEGSGETGGHEGASEDDDFWDDSA